MEGPTPVSALIHAATWVTAGVFMVLPACRRCSRPATPRLAVVTLTGAATALFAATVGTVQNDIKRVIAYSTLQPTRLHVSSPPGVGAYRRGDVPPVHSRFFKALLFLGAGSVIHAMHHEQDMRYYGALRKEIPWTFWAMTVGTLAITGVGIIQVAGLPSLGLRRLLLQGRDHRKRLCERRRLRPLRLLRRVFAALLTSFYSWRLVFLTFFGKARWAGVRAYPARAPR